MALDAIGNEVDAAVRPFFDKGPPFDLIAHQAQWHMRGCVYHMRALHDSYARFARDVGARAGGHDVPPVALIMYAPSLQEAMFNFYALVNLAKITLDNLRIYLRPVFKTDFRQLPKSLSGFLEGTTDCPVYADLASQLVVSYLSDLRNCLVHFRSFATGDNVIVINDDVPQDEEEALLGSHSWVDTMARARFRIVDRGVSVNLFVPDVIFDRSTHEKLARFTYAERYHLVSQGTEFVRLIRYALLRTFALLAAPGVPTYTFGRPRKRGSG